MESALSMDTENVGITRNVLDKIPKAPGHYYRNDSTRMYIFSIKSLQNIGRRGAVVKRVEHISTIVLVNI